jgi:hypothetical protein
VAGVTVHNGATSASTKVAVAVASGICAGAAPPAFGRGSLEDPNLEGPISSNDPGSLAGLISSSRGDGPLSSSRVLGSDRAPVSNEFRRSNNRNSLRVGGMRRPTDRGSVAIGSAKEVVVLLRAHPS